MIKSNAICVVLFCTLSLFLSGAIHEAEARDGLVQSEKETFVVQTLTTGLVNPWGIVKLPDGRFLVTELAGRLRIIDPTGELKPTPVVGVPQVWARGQGGLLDIELHPDYATNGWIYFAWSKPIGDGALTAVSRARLRDGALVDLETVFDPPASEATNNGVHFGVRLEFDAQNNLHFAIGDRGGPTNPTNPAQFLDNVRGKSHRVSDTGAIPHDNPFRDNPQAVASIWTYGNRNIQGMRFRPGTNELWATEHGPRGGDELNLLKQGVNYGWPVVTNGINYNGTPITNYRSRPDMQNPVIDWTPSIGVCGIDFYTGKKFPGWNGDLFVAALAARKLIRVDFENGKPIGQEDLLDREDNTGRAGRGRVRDVRCFNDGYVYVIYDAPGQIVRLVPANEATVSSVP
jgi:glucose/arabinose dehydrogenase